MGKFIDLTGRRFGRWIAIERSNKDSKGQSCYWLCRCVCGKEKEVYGSSLIQGISKSCGCYKTDMQRERKKIEYGLAAKNRTYLFYRRGAIKRNVLFELTFDQFLELAKQNCYYCNLEPLNICKVKSKNGDFTYQGIDRIDNTKGYILGNVVPCCKDCNSAKGKRSYENFINWINRVHNNVSMREDKNESKGISKFSGARYNSSFASI